MQKTKKFAARNRKSYDVLLVFCTVSNQAEMHFQLISNFSGLGAFPDPPRRTKNREVFLVSKLSRRPELFFNSQQFCGLRLMFNNLPEA